MQGYLNKIATKQGSGRYGPYTTYNLEIDGQWYGHGFNKPNAHEGQYVEFDVIQKGQYKNAENLRAAVSTPPAASSGSKAPASIPVNNRDVSIQYQSSHKDAIQVLDVLLKNDAVKLPAKQADKYDAAMALVDEITAQFYLKLESVIQDGGVSLEDAIPQPAGDE